MDSNWGGWTPGWTVSTQPFTPLLDSVLNWVSVSPGLELKLQKCMIDITSFLIVNDYSMIDLAVNCNWVETMTVRFTWFLTTCHLGLTISISGRPARSWFFFCCLGPFESVVHAFHKFRRRKSDDREDNKSRPCGDPARDGFAYPHCDLTKDSPRRYSPGVPDARKILTVTGPFCLDAFCLDANLHGRKLLNPIFRNWVEKKKTCHAESVACCLSRLINLRTLSYSFIRCNSLK